MSLWKEFKAFAMKGNVIDMAVGIIIGAAFGKIVNSLVNDVLMPPIGVLLGKTDFSQFGLTIKEAVVEGDKVVAEAVRLNYGMFINTVINFLIVAVAIFALIKVISLAKKKEEAAPAPAPAPSNQEVLLTEIRDILKKNKDLGCRVKADYCSFRIRTWISFWSLSRLTSACGLVCP